MAVNYARQPFAPQPKDPKAFRALTKDEASKGDDKEKRKVDAEVDARDGKRCRCCGRRGNPYATTTLGRIHRAHIQDASKIGPYVAKNLCSLCWICHALEHAKKLWFKGTDANSMPMRFEIAASVVEKVFGKRQPQAHVKVLKGV